jgi:hypothetical protein
MASTPSNAFGGWDGGWLAQAQIWWGSGRRISGGGARARATDSDSDYDYVKRICAALFEAHDVAYHDWHPVTWRAQSISPYQSLRHFAFHQGLRRFTFAARGGGGRCVVLGGRISR